MTKIKVEFEIGEAMSVSCAIKDYKQKLQKAKHNPNDILAKSICVNCTKQLGTAYTKIEKAIQEI